MGALINLAMGLLVGALFLGFILKGFEDWPSFFAMVVLFIIGGITISIQKKAGTVVATLFIVALLVIGVVVSKSLGFM